VSAAAVALGVLLQLAPGGEKLAAPAADIIARAVDHEAEPERWAALLAVYVVRESSMRPDAVGDGGRSCGLVQLRCEWTAHLDAEGQLRLWLRLVHASSLGAVDSSPSRAARRAELAERLRAKVSP